MRAAAALVEGDDLTAGVARALAETRAGLGGAPVDLALLFASPSFASEFPALVRQVWTATGAPALIGSSGQAVIGLGHEVEDRPALSLLTLSLPGVGTPSAHVTPGEVTGLAPGDWQRRLDAAPDDVAGLLVLADPFTLDAEALLAGLAAAYPGRPIVGGLASGDRRRAGTHLFHGGAVVDEGAVVLALTGAVRLLPVVSQGCQPIGETWTITGVEENLITSIGNRPACDVLIETLQALPPGLRLTAQRNLLVGLAVDEYRASYGRGDFLIRNLLGADRASGVVAVASRPRLGQTLQFQMRDAAAADEDLRLLLGQARAALAGQQPAAALLCACNGRGAGLFGAANHDAAALAEAFGPLPVTGLFCNGEIGPVGGLAFVHGFTASLALLAPPADAGPA